MAVASSSIARMTLPRALLLRSVSSSLASTNAMHPFSTYSSSTACSSSPLEISSQSRSPSSRGRSFSTTPRHQRSPQPSQPARSPAAAEPAVVKSPDDPPNPASWPGQSKKSVHASSRRDPFAEYESSHQTQQSLASDDAPHAESSKAALEREQKSAAKSQETQDSDSAACATLSPSSPSSPRSQGKEKAKEASNSSTSAATPKAAAPEATAAAAKTPGKFSSPNASGKAFRAKKEALKLTPLAVERLRELLDSDSGPRLIRIGVRNKGCAGMSYHLEYVTPDQAGKFDERVKQDGVEVLIDSKALFSIIGSEMDWKEDTLSAKFVFNNPNVKESCGCGESFLT